MSDLCIVGAGGHGVVVADAAQASGHWSAIAFFDDRWPEVQSVDRWQVLGTLATLRERVAVGDDLQVVVAIGENRRRLELTRELAAAGARLATVVHPFTAISPSAEIGAGTVVMAGAVVNPRARIGDAAILNTRASVDHDCQIGHGAHLCPGSTLAGNVTVRDLAWVGIGSSVIQGVTIGTAALVGAGAAVIRNVREGTKVAGCPAREMQRDS